MSKWVQKVISPVVLVLFVLTNVLGVSAFAAEDSTNKVEISPNVNIDAPQVITKEGDKYSTGTPKSGKAGEFQMEETQNVVVNGGGDINILDYPMKKEVVFLLDTSGSLSFTDITQTPPFEYGIYSGSESTPFSLEGTDLNINGNIHSNDYVSVASGSLNIIGDKSVCESHNTHSVQMGNCNLPKNRKIEDVFLDNKEARTLPSITDIVKDETNTDFKVTDVRAKDPRTDSAILFSAGDGSVLCTQDGNAMFKPTPSSPPLGKDFPKDGFDRLWLSYNTKQYKEKISKGNRNLGTFVIAGDSELVIKDKQTYCFEGNLVITNSKGIKFEGSGRITATGDILLEGGGISSNSESEAKGFESLIYSERGDIKVYPGFTSTFYGVIYAPKGIAYFGTNGITVNGSVAADQVAFGASTMNIKAIKGKLSEDVTKRYPVSYLSTAKAAITKFTGYMKEHAESSDVDVGIITYNESANPEPEKDKKDKALKLYKVKTSDKDKEEYNDLIGRLTAIGEDDSRRPSNLSDGLRRAYELLRSSDEDAAKFVVVITASVPNAWTTSIIQKGDQKGDAASIEYYYKKGDLYSPIGNTKLSVSAEALSEDIFRNNGIEEAKKQVARINALNKNTIAGSDKVKLPNTSFIAICQKPDRSDPKYKDISDVAWNDIEKTCTSISAILPSVYKDINGNKEVYTIDTGLEDMNKAMEPIANKVKNTVIKPSISSATIKITLPKGTASSIDYFKAVPVPDPSIQLNDGSRNFMTDKAFSTGESPDTDTEISRIWKSGNEEEGRDPLITVDEKNSEENTDDGYTFKIGNIYLPLKYVPKGTTRPTDGETRETMEMSVEITLNMRYMTKSPTGNPKLQTVSKTATDTYTFEVVDKVDIN